MVDKRFVVVVVAVVDVVHQDDLNEDLFVVLEDVVVTVVDEIKFVVLVIELVVGWLVVVVSTLVDFEDQFHYPIENNKILENFNTKFI